jgi:DnaJ-class molecular chaperone
MRCLFCKGSRFVPTIPRERKEESTPPWIGGKKQEAITSSFSITEQGPSLCGECSGTGEVPAEKYPHPCPACHGENPQCSRCLGNGRVPEILAKL